jgi:hypothetical protein
LLTGVNARGREGQYAVDLEGRLVVNLAKGFLFALLLSLLFVSRASAVNDQNNSVLKLTPAEQAAFFSRALAGVGTECTGKDAFYQGIIADTAYWSVRCANGQEYSVEIRNSGKIGSVEDCKELLTTPVKCFQRIAGAQPEESPHTNKPHASGELPQTPIAAAALIMGTLFGMSSAAHMGLTITPS